MAKHNAKNERIKREYMIYLREAQRRNTVSVDAAAKALSRFEEANGFKDFAQFHHAQAVAFKSKLDKQLAMRTGERLSKATIHSTLNTVKAFFIWLAGQPGYKSKLSYSDADYFNLSQNDVRIATAKREKAVPTLAQIHHVLSIMPSATDIEKRNRALIAFAILTGARDGALASFKLKHVDLTNSMVNQDAREVKTKFRKTFTTTFFPVGGDALAIVTDWIAHLRGSLLRCDQDALFPATERTISPDGGFAFTTLKRGNWGTAAPIRRIYRNAFAAADLPYFNPHSFRHTLVQLGETMCQTPEQFKAWSQNLGHDGVLTTFTSYGTLSPHKQSELIKGLANKRENGTDTDAVKELARKVLAMN